MRLSGDEMARVDRYAIDVLEIPGILLMENAALACLKHIDLVKNTKYTLVCGTGNNGADGLALARHLLNYDHDVKIIILGELNEENKEYMTYYRILKNLGQKFHFLTNESDLESLEEAAGILKEADLIIDAIFGTGLNSPIRGVHEYLVDMINNAGRKIFSVDIPSGIDSNEGKILGTSVNADTVVSFQFMKEGLFRNKDIVGEVFVENISIPKLAVNKALK